MTEPDDTTTDRDDTTTDRDDTTTDAGDARPATSEPAAADAAPPAADDGRDATDYLLWGAFAVLLLLALVAVVRFYFSASRAIDVWIAADYVPIFQSAFNLAVLFGCAVGLSLLVRRLKD